MRRSMLALTLASALALPARGQAPDEVEERILLLSPSARTDVDDKALLADVQERFRANAEEAFGGRVVVENRARSARCVTSSSCVGNLTKKAGAMKGVAVLVGAAGEGFEVSYLVADAAGGELLAGARTYSRSELVEGVGSLVLELLMPASLSGKLVVPAIDDDAYALLDGVPASSARLREGVALTLGPHVLTILRPEQAAEVHEVDVRFGKDATVEIAPPPPPRKSEVRLVMPWWPAVAAGGLAAGALATGVVFTFDYAYAVITERTQLAELGNTLAERRAFPAEAARQPELGSVRAAGQTDVLIIGATLVASGVATAAAVALAGAWFFGDRARPDAEGPGT